MSGPIVVKLWDSQWVNIVNHPNVINAPDTESSVYEAVKLTELAMAKNYMEDNWPPYKGDKDA